MRRAQFVVALLLTVPFALPAARAEDELTQDEMVQDLEQMAKVVKRAWA